MYYLIRHQRTLAIIAYNEPITRVEIDDLRGVDSSYIVRRLLAKGLIKECGKSDLPGKPILYKTTDDFLDYFGLSSINELPSLDNIEENNDEKDLFKSIYKDEEQSLFFYIVIGVNKKTYQMISFYFDCSECILINSLYIYGSSVISIYISFPSFLL